MTTPKIIKFTPKMFRKNAEETLSKCENELCQIVKQERDIQENKNNCLSEIRYWEDMLK